MKNRNSISTVIISIVLFLLPLFSFSQAESDAAITTYWNDNVKSKTWNINYGPTLFKKLIDSKVSLLGSYSDPSWITTLSGSKVIAAGSNTYVQLNSGGFLGASSNFTYDGTFVNFYSSVAPQLRARLNGQGLVFDGTTFGAGVAFQITTQSRSTSDNINIQPAQPTSGNGGSVSLTGGNGASSGNTNGGNITLNPGSGFGTGVSGNISLFNSLPLSYGGGSKVLYFNPAAVLPTTALSSGGVMYVKPANNLPYWWTGTSEYSMIGLTPPSGTSSQLLGNNGSNGFSNVTVGGGLNYSGGILSASTSSQFYGSILNQTSFPNTTGFTNVGGTTLTIVSNAIQFSGGGGTATSLSKHLDYNYTSGLEYVRVTGVFTVQGTINSTSYGFGLGNLGIDASHGTVGVRFNMTTSNGGQLTLVDGTGAGSVIMTSPSNCTFSLNDQIELVYERREDQLICTAKNLTAGGSAGVAQITWSYNIGAAVPLQPTTGKYGIYYFGGTFSLNSLSIYSNEIKNADLLIVGDSKVNGYVAPHVTRFATLLRNNTNKTVVSAGGSETIANVQSKSAEIIALNPKKILLMIGSNDVRASSATVNSDFSNLVTTFTNAGMDVYVGLLWENAAGGGVDQSSLNTYLKSTYPTKYIDTWSVLNSAMLSTDGIHPNESGNQFIYKRLLQSGLIDNPKSDYTPYQRYYFTNSNQAEYISIFNEATSSTAQAGFKMTVGTDLSGLNSNYIRTTTTGAGIPNALIIDVRTSGGYVVTLDGSTKNFSLVTSGASLGGNFTLLNTGNKILIKSGTNASAGTATLVGGTVTVNTTAVTANSIIHLTSQADGGTPGFLRITTKTAGTSFVITSSSASDTSTVGWWIMDAN